MITLTQFREAFHALRFVDRADLIAAGVPGMHLDATWEQFRHCPLKWVLRAPREHADLVWRAVQASGLPSEGIAR